MNMTCDEQIEELKKTGTGPLLNLARPALVVTGLGLLIAGIVTANPVFYAAAVAAGFLSLAVWLRVPHLQNAARGLTEGIMQNGTIDICLLDRSDGERTYKTFGGTLSIDHQPLWKMDFFQPRGWEPAPGVYPARLVFIRAVEWPVVLILDDGILYPETRPKRLSSSQIMS